MQQLICKPGDRALVIKGKHNLGRVVNVIRVLDAGDTYTDHTGKVWNVNATDAGKIWQTVEWCTVMLHLSKIVPDLDDRLIKTQIIHDYALLPLNDPEGEDETLAWKPVPKLETV